MKQIKKLQIGKRGLTREFIEQIKSIFKNEKMIKISILKSACRNKDDADKIGEGIINALGKNFVCKRIGYVLTIRKFRRDVR